MAIFPKVTERSDTETNQREVKIIRLVSYIEYMDIVHNTDGKSQVIIRQLKCEG